MVSSDIVPNTLGSTIPTLAHIVVRSTLLSTWFSNAIDGNIWEETCWPALENWTNSYWLFIMSKDKWWKIDDWWWTSWAEKNLKNVTDKEMALNWNSHEYLKVTSWNGCFNCSRSACHLLREMWGRRKTIEPRSGAHTAFSLTKKNIMCCYSMQRKN